MVNISASSYPTTYDKDWIEIESRNRRRIHVLSLENLSCLCFGNIQKMKDYNHQLIRSSEYTIIADQGMFIYS